MLTDNRLSIVGSSAHQKCWCLQTRKNGGKAFLLMLDIWLEWENG
jgi:hypothetical protein